MLNPNPFGGTIGEIIARRSRGEDLVLPEPEQANKMPLNRADARRLVRLLPRDLRKEFFGVWRKRGVPDGSVR